MEQFENNYTTLLNGAIDDDDTTIVVDAGPITMTGSFRIKIDDEIIFVGSVATTTFSNCVRGYEGTTPASHSDDAPVVHLLTAGALRSALGTVSFIDSVKLTADTPDDEFNSTSLDGKWTAVSGSSGSAILTSSGLSATAALYDLTSRPGWMLMQNGTTTGNNIYLRQDYTIPDGSSIVVAIALPSASIDAATGWAADELQVGISLNSDDSTPLAGATGIDFYAIETDANVSDIQTVGRGQGSGANGTSTIWRPVGTLIFLRIARNGLVYYPFFSMDGYAWAPMDDLSFAAAHTNLWIWHRNAAAAGTPTGISAWAWVRLGSNAIDPWSWL